MARPKGIMTVATEREVVERVREVAPEINMTRLISKLLREWLAKHSAEQRAA